MLDVWHTPQGSTAVTQQWFYARGSDWQPYELPRGCSQVFIWTVGGGGGGGAGLTGATATGRGGGSGGGSGALTRCLFPRFALPDLIYIQPGSSVGTGATGQSAGSNGGNTYIASVISTNAFYLYVLANGGGAGQLGLSGGAASTGAAGVVTTAANCQLISASNWVSVAGVNGGAAGSGAGTGSGGGSTVWGSPGINCGGAGGGSSGSSNASNFGGGLNGAGLMPSIGAAAIGTNGVMGPMFFKPFMSAGGTGGPGSGAGAGGTGGAGALGGSGGAGGGGGITGGAGGDGGNGLVLIVCF
jgi:hypothetical protein